jgi:hypothetical protein
MTLEMLSALVAALPDESRRAIPELRTLAELCELFLPFVAEPGCGCPPEGEGLVECAKRKLRENTRLASELAGMKERCAKVCDDLCDHWNARDDSITGFDVAECFDGAAERIRALPPSDAERKP